MRKRTRARESALKVLYQIDINKEELEEGLENFYKGKGINSAIREFSSKLVEGTVKKLAQIDKVITECAENWTIDRMAIIDRNILRMAIFELIFRKDIPPKVSINEAIELAKRYGDEDSPRFVNGILDKVFRNFSDKKSKPI